MPGFIILVSILLALLLLRFFLRTPAGVLAAQWRYALLSAGLGAALLLAATGRIFFALCMLIPLFFLWQDIVRQNRKSKKKPLHLISAGTRSLLRSAALEIDFYPATGAMEGRVLVGTFEGRDLASLDQRALARLAQEIASDAESRVLLEAYLDRNVPRWRHHIKMNARSRLRRPADAGAMSKEEAYQILGLQNGADETEIRAAHRRLIKKVHPDSGGSTFLAARINEAKNRLLSKHR